ncbi:MAG: hypothetical protein M1826_004253 [Phylliscum demangeonii]|nr:MAG: hypothetical protein M1826_004253 [Phylliscum demangeonii]
MSSTPAHTVIDLKKAFIASQIRLLSAPIQPPADWQDRLAEPEQGDLRESVIKEVLHKVHVITRHHTRASYPAQTVRAVAEQIDAVYWASAEGDGGARAGSEEANDGRQALRRDVDLRVDELTEDRPLNLDEEDDEDDVGYQRRVLRERYGLLHTQLTQLAAQRRAAHAKRQRYTHLQRLLAPYQRSIPLAASPEQDDDDDEDKLAGELERMSGLVARLQRRVQTAGANHGNSNSHNNEAPAAAPRVDAPPAQARSDADKILAIVGMAVS